MAYYDNDLVARWYIDEGINTTVGDSETTPFDLTFDDTANTAWDTTSDQGGIAYTTANSNGRVYSNSLPTKITNALNAVAFTIEMVVHVDSLAADDQFLFSVTDTAGGYAPISIQLNNDNIIRVNHMFSTTGFDTIQFARNITTDNRVVLHLVVNTNEPSSANRVKLFLNAVQVSQTGGNQPGTQDEVLSAASGHSMGLGCLGQASTTQRTIDGIIHFAAIHSSALDGTQIGGNNTSLLASDDSFSNTVPDTPTVTATPNGTQVDLTTSVYNDTDGDPHSTSRYQIYQEL
jgi:hypothetical protein